VTLHDLGPALGEVRWAGHPQLHCITFTDSTGGGCALDLATRGRVPGDRSAGPDLVSRALLAADRRATGSPPYEVPVHTRPTRPKDKAAGGRALVRVSAGTYILRHPPRPFSAVAPQRDGKPLLDGADIHRAQLAGDVLALAFTRDNERGILLIHGPDGALLGAVPHPVKGAFALSPDGRLLARRDVDRSVAVTTSTARPVAVAPAAALHDAVAVELVAAPFQLVVRVGGYRHAFGLAGGELTYKARWEVSARAARTMSTLAVSATAHDTARFPPLETAHAWGWHAVVDRMGQVLLFRGTAGPLVAAFVIRRERAAAWAPGGTFWGDPRLIGGPATPDAARTIGRAITALEGA
jgi:hypothetical protein